MKILLLHNFYQSASPSGEDAVYDQEVRMLREREVEVIRYERHIDEVSGPLGTLKTTTDQVWSRKTYREVSALIKKEKPDQNSSTPEVEEWKDINRRSSSGNGP